MPSRTATNPHQGDTVTFLETASETGGKHSLVAIAVQPGGGPPEHFHTEFDEEIYAAKGPLLVTIAGKERVLRQGERVVVPRGVCHAWKNASDTEVTFHACMRPGHLGFENFLRINAGLGRDGGLNETGVPRNPMILALLAVSSNTNLPGLLRMLTPLLRWLARRAEASGLGDRLRKRYECELPGVKP